MTHSGSDDMLAGLDADPYERMVLDEVLDEVEAEEAAGLPYDADGDADGGPADPEDDDPRSWAGQLEAAGAALDDTAARDAQRLAEDVYDAIPGRTPTDEVRAARALRRIEAGTYTPDPYSRGDPAAAAAARDPSGRWASACGDLDEFSRCSAKYHQAGCHVVTEAAAANGSATEAEAWTAQLRGQPMDPGALGFANESGAEPHDPLGVDFDDVLDDGQRLPYEQLRDRITHRMGLSDRQDREPLPGPHTDVRWAREALGI